jgi:hypothetical protein
MAEDELPDRCCGCVGDYCCKHGKAPCPTEEAPVAETPTTLTVDIAADLTVIRPGDTVLVTVPADIPAFRVQRIAEQLRERLPDVADVLVLAGADSITAYRP